MIGSIVSNDKERNKAMNKSEKFWDKIAVRYSQSHIKDMDGYNKTLDHARKYLQKGMSVLEIGCGSGSTALNLADSGADITATDISSNMIAIANGKAKEQKIENVEFKQATLFDQSNKQGSYDAILAFNVIHLLGNIRLVMKRVSELLKPDGILISKTLCLKENSVVWPIIGSIVSSAMGAGQVNCLTAADLKESIIEEGFEIIDSFAQMPKPVRIFIVARKNNKTAPWFAE